MFGGIPTDDDITDVMLTPEFHPEDVLSKHPLAMKGVSMVMRDPFNQKMSQQPDYKMSELVQVEVHLVKEYSSGGGNQANVLTTIVPREHLDTFIDAQVKLHHYPGVNPHDGAVQHKLVKVRWAKLECAGPYWWTTPDLMKNDDPNGVCIIQGMFFRDAWIHGNYTSLHRHQVHQSEKC